MKNIQIIITTILTILLFLSISSCEKKEIINNGYPLPPVHPSGRQVTCNIDGQLWSHGVDWCPMCFSLQKEYYSDTKILFFNANNFLEEPFKSSLNIYIYVDSVGPTNFNWSGPTYSDYSRIGLCENCNSTTYYPDSTCNNQFYIDEFDLEKKNIKGTFSFRVINYDCPDTVLITDGYFDLNPYWY